MPNVLESLRHQVANGPTVDLVKQDTAIADDVATDLVDLSDLPLSRIGSLADAGLLKRVLPEPSTKRVAVAAFQSSI